MPQELRGPSRLLVLGWEKQLSVTHFCSPGSGFECQASQQCAEAVPLAFESPSHASLPSSPSETLQW